MTDFGQLTDEKLIDACRTGDEGAWVALVERYERLVYTESPADEKGNVVSPSAMGMPEGYPAMTEVTVLLEYLDGRTKMVMTHAGVPASSGANAGWEQAFDKLADHIETVLNDK